MKVKHDIGKKKKFFMLCPGTVFMAESIAYMKTDVIITGSKAVFNAVILETGEFGQFGSEDLVCPCYDAELLIP
jgi:hypothetical protein